MEETEKVHAIPVGLENLYRLTNGFPWVFAGEADFSPNYRPESVFACFKISTNPHIRSRVREQIMESRHRFCDERLAPMVFSEMVKRAKFVVSPPGNGLDCHRTWESIYLGAVPVILSGTLAPKLVDNLPILEVQSYSEFLELSEHELDDMYETIRRSSTQMAYMPYWVRELWGYDRGGLE